MLELEGLQVAVEAQVECEPPPDTWCHVKCQQHQVRTVGGHRRWPQPVVSLSCCELVTGQALTLDSRWTPQLGHMPCGVPFSRQGFLYSSSIAHLLLFHPGIPEFQF